MSALRSKIQRGRGRAERTVWVEVINQRAEIGNEVRYSESDHVVSCWSG